jgi:transcription factor HY5
MSDINTGDAVVPETNALPYIPFGHNSMMTTFQNMGVQKDADPNLATAYLRNEAALVPQLSQQQYARLTSSQQAELELARRRAQKAAEGKRANATAARRAKRKAQQRAAATDTTSDKDEEDMVNMRQHHESEHGQTDSDIEAKLANVKDQKEAKRLKRLLRNRVSAQQARERKKSYVQDLEAKCQSQDQKTAQMEQRIKVLERENVMLRSVIKNMQGGFQAANSENSNMSQ